MRPSTFRTALIAVALSIPALSIPALASAQTASPASASADAPIASGRADAVDAQIQNYLDATAGPAADAQGPSLIRPSQQGPVDRSPHGEFSVGVGSDGYRHVDAAIEAPIGNIGSAAVAVSQTNTDGRHWQPRKSQSLSVAVALGDAAGPARADLPCSDRSGRSPLWIQRLRASRGETGALCPLENR